MSITTALILYALLCLFTAIFIHGLCKLAPLRDYEDEQDRLTRLAIKAKRENEMQAIERYLEREDVA